MTNLFGTRSKKQLIKQTLIKMLENELYLYTLICNDETIMVFQRIKNHFHIFIKKLNAKVKCYVVSLAVVFATLFSDNIYIPTAYAQEPDSTNQNIVGAKETGPVDNAKSETSSRSKGTVI